MTLSTAPLSKLGARQETTGTPYEQVTAGKPPIPITVAPRPSSARIDFHPLLRNGGDPEPPLPQPSDGSSSRQFKLVSDPRRDSAVAVSQTTARNSHATVATNTTNTTNTTDDEGSPRVKKSPSLLRINGAGPRTPPPPQALPPPPPPSSTPPTTTMAAASAAASTAQPARLRQKSAATKHAAEESPFVGLTTDIPSPSFGDLLQLDKVEFSKRGSMLISGKKAAELDAAIAAAPPAESVLAAAPIRHVTPDEEVMSRRVRTMYATGLNGDMPAVPEGRPVSHVVGGVAGADGETAAAAASTSSPPIRIVSTISAPASDTAFVASCLRGSVIREEHELAGGIEDWQDVEGGDVDRYGFISPKPPPGLGSTTSLPPTASPQLHRVSTQLQLLSDQPRRGGSRLSRSASHSKSTRSAQDLHSRASRVRPESSQGSYRSTASTSSRFRSATNRLPHNRSRRLMDEAGDMLTLPPGLADIAAQRDGGRMSSAQKQKEWEREGKWRKMARVVRRDGHGGGMTFDFDTRDPKLIERTWKGIPDRWRATAWYAFLSASARRRGGQPKDTTLRAAFAELQDHPSPDDGQIDTDVPRTIGSHIMFRTRYRGGQRLLFRVLHALSLFFPETGYVQGMAALAATLLCYFDEQMAFVMLVRLWMLRGLDQLYASGFDGLLAAFRELDARWLAQGPVGAKLRELQVEPTAFGTRWYLTLFNYSIPFPAQLRVWDVFFLLGDPIRPYPSPVTALSAPGPADKRAAAAAPAQPTAGADAFHGGLDVLHATAAALVDATREILLDSEFENAMKTLTSWVPVRDEDLLMRVAKAEYRRGRRRR